MVNPVVMRMLNWGTEQAQAEVRNIWRLLSARHESSDALPPEAVRLAADAGLPLRKRGCIISVTDYARRSML